MRNIEGMVSIVIPAFNEGVLIRKNLEEIVHTFEGFGCQYEIVVIDDGSQDETLSEALKVAEVYPNIKVKRNLENFGKGRGLKKSFRYTRGEYVVFLDADLDLHPAQVQTLFDIMRLDDVDVVIGSKMHPNSKVFYPVGRRVISFFYFLFIKLIFGLPLHDTQTGLKLFKRKVLKEVFPRLLVKKFAFDLELLALAHRRGYKIAEAPIVLQQMRRYGRLGFKAMWQTGWDTLAVFYRMYIMKFYDRF